MAGEVIIFYQIILIVSLLVNWIIHVPDLARALRSLVRDLWSLRRHAIGRILPDMRFVDPDIVRQLFWYILLLIVIVVNIARLQLNIADEVVVHVAIHVFHRFSPLQWLMVACFWTHALDMMLALILRLIRRTGIFLRHHDLMLPGRSQPVFFTFGSVEVVGCERLPELLWHHVLLRFDILILN